MSMPFYKMEADECIPVPCDDFKTLCRLAKCLSFRIAETLLIFWTFFDVSKPLPSSEPIGSTSGDNASVIVDIWTGNLCCRVRSGTSACIAEPVTSSEGSGIRWFCSSKPERRAQYLFCLYI